MRVLVAPDSFGGTLSSVEAASAIATGWRSSAPDDELDLAPLSDGGPGFVDVLFNALGGDRLPVEVHDPLGRRVPASWLRVGDTAYVESAQACGLHLVAPAQRDPVAASTTGVGELLGAALDAGVGRIVVGLGGSATTDGGRGALEALGGRRVDGVRLVAATDVDNPLLGATGAAAVFGPQKGADPATVRLLDDRLREWAAAFDPALAEAPGAGAAGGLGFALFILGAVRESGLSVVTDAVGLRERVGRADLVLTGEGSFDAQSLRGKVPAGVAALAQAHGVPCLVLAGQVAAGRREAAAAGIEAAYAVADELGSVEAALTRPGAGLSTLAARVAKTWSGGIRGG